MDSRNSGSADISDWYHSFFINISYLCCMKAELLRTLPEYIILPFLYTFVEILQHAS